MVNNAKFIWLNKDLYPLLQDSCVSIFSKDRKKYRYGVAAFKKSFVYDKKITKAETEIFGDTRFYLWLNGDFTGTGPCPTGGDYEMPYQYQSLRKQVCQMQWRNNYVAGRFNLHQRRGRTLER